MDCWKVLGLDEPSSDLRTIKKHYAKQLKKTNPEDDPAGFQELREAFEQAKMLAQHIDHDLSRFTSPPDTDTTPDFLDTLYDDVEQSDLPPPQEANRHSTELEHQEDNSAFDFSPFSIDDSDKANEPRSGSQEQAVEQFLLTAENEDTKAALQQLDRLLDGPLLSLDEREEFTNELLDRIVDHTGPSIFDEAFYEGTANRLGIELHTEPHYSDSLDLWSHQRFALRAEVARLEAVMLNQQLKTLSDADQKALAVLLGIAPLSSIVKRPRSNLREENALNVQLEKLFIASPEAAREIISNELLNWAEQHDIPEHASKKTTQSRQQTTSIGEVEEGSKKIGWLVFFAFIILFKVAGYLNTKPEPAPTHQGSQMRQLGIDQWENVQRKIHQATEARRITLETADSMEVFQPDQFSIVNHNACLSHLDQYIQLRLDEKIGLSRNEGLRRSDEICRYLHLRNEDNYVDTVTTNSYATKYQFSRCDRLSPPLYCNPIISKGYPRFTDELKSVFAKCVDDLGIAKALNPGFNTSDPALRMKLRCQQMSGRLLNANNKNGIGPAD